MTGDGDGKIGTLMLGVSGNILVSGSVGNTKLGISIESEWGEEVLLWKGKIVSYNKISLEIKQDLVSKSYSL